MDTHNTLQAAMPWAITEARARQINLQLTSFLRTLFHSYAKLLPKDIIIIRKYMEDKAQVLGKRLGGWTFMSRWRPNPYKFESSLASRTTLRDMYVLRFQWSIYGWKDNSISSPTPLVSPQNAIGVNGIVEMMRPPPLTGSGGGRSDLVGGIGRGRHGSGGLPCPDGSRFRAFLFWLTEVAI